MSRPNWPVGRALVCLAAALAASPAIEARAQQECPDTTARAAVDERVVQAGSASLAEWPGLAALRFRDPAANEELYFCGGTVVHKDWIVTAAHCISTTGIGRNRSGEYTNARGEAFEAVVGVEHLNAVKSEHVHRIAEVITHEHFVKAAEGNDIALLKLVEPSSGHSAPPSKLAVSTSADNVASYLFRVAGFGAQSFGEKLQRFVRPSDNVLYYAHSQQLRATTVPEVPIAECRGAYGTSATIGNGQLCGGYLWGRDDACQGDSGGPLMFIDGKGSPRFSGVVSWGKGCGEPGKFGVYTRLSAHEDWLRAKSGGAVQFRTSCVSPVRQQQLKLIDQIAKDLAPASSGLQVVLSRGLRLERNKVYWIGVESRTAGRLILIDIEPSGTVRQIFPNQFSVAEAAGRASGPGHRVMANKLIRIPDRQLNGFDAFRVEGEPGKGTMIGIVVPDAFPYDDLVSHPDVVPRGQGEDKFATIGQAGSASYLVRLVQQIELTMQGEAARSGSPVKDAWAFAMLDYEVVP